MLALIESGPARELRASILSAARMRRNIGPGWVGSEFDREQALSVPENTGRNGLHETALPYWQWVL